MKLPGEYQIDFSMFFDSSVWHIQQKGINIKLQMVTSRIDRNLKIFYSIWDFIWL